MDKNELTLKIKNYAKELGFDACGVCRAGPVDNLDKEHFEDWVSNNYNGEMEYMSRNVDKRLDPTILVEGAKAVISLALNYYPHELQQVGAPQFAYYAYGKDYHEVMKEKLKSLYEYIGTLTKDVEGRFFCDTAPILERYWAAKAGLGFIGKNSLLIIPKMGSYFFLGEIIINIDLEYDTPLNLSCGSCRRCLDACPTKAIIHPKIIDSKKCLSYQTIENKGEISPEIIPNMNNKLYGCDTCQQVCPWNHYASPHSTDEFIPSSEFIALDWERMEKMTVEDYQRIFKGSAIKRAKYSGLKRNLAALKQSKI